MAGKIWCLLFNGNTGLLSVIGTHKNKKWKETKNRVYFVSKPSIKDLKIGNGFGPLILWIFNPWGSIIIKEGVSVNPGICKTDVTIYKFLMLFPIKTGIKFTHVDSLYF